MTKATAVITRDGAEERRVELPDAGSWPIFIGSASECAIRLDASGIAERQARLDWASNHIFVTLLAPGPVSANDEPLTVGKETRVDFTPFRAGPFTVRIDY